MATMNLGTLFVKLNAESKSFAKEMHTAAEAVEKFAKTSKKLANEVAGAAGTMLAIGGAAVKLASTVDGRAAVAMDKLERSIKLLAVQVADLLLPAVAQLTAWFRSAADWVAGLDPELRKQIATWAVWAAGIAVVGKALGVFLGLVDEVAGALGTAFKAVAGVGIVPLLKIVAVIAAIVAIVIVLHRVWRTNWSGIQEKVATVFEWMRGALTTAAGWFRKWFNANVDGAEALVMSLLAVGEAMEKLTGIKVGTGAAGLREGFKGLFADLRSGDFILEGIAYAKDVADTVADMTIEEIKIIKGEVMNALGLEGGGTGKKARKPGFFRPIGDTTGKAQHSMATMAQKFLADVAEQNAIVEWADASLREMDAADKKLAKERAKEIETRRQMREDLEKMRRINRASATGNLEGLSQSERVQATADTGGNWADLGEAQKNLGNFMNRMGPSMLSALGKAGQSIGNIIQGAQAGGPFGAVVAALLEVFQTMESFTTLITDLGRVFSRVGEFLEPLIGSLFDFIGDVLAVVTEALGPVFSALQPLFEGLLKPIKAILPIIGLLAPLFMLLAPLIEILANVIGGIVDALTPILRVLFEVARVVFIVIGSVVAVILEIWNGLIEAIASMATFILNIVTLGLAQSWAKGVGDEIRKGKADMGKFNADLQNLGNATWETTNATAAATAAKWDEERATKEATAAASGLAESLTNVPSGYKVAFQQWSAQSPSGYDEALGLGGEGSMQIVGGVSINVMQPVDPVAFKAMMERWRSQKRGRFSDSGE